MRLNDDGATWASADMIPRRWHSPVPLFTSWYFPNQHNEGIKSPLAVNTVQKEAHEWRRLLGRELLLARKIHRGNSITI